MKRISIRELHANTGEWVRKAARHGAILVTDRGKGVARIVPEETEPEVPYFSRREILPAFRRLMATGRLRGGTDSTRAISEEREGRES